MRAGIGYLAGAWLLVQVLETLLPVFGIAETRIRWIVLALAVAFLPVMALSWAFEWTTEGIRRETASADAVRIPGSRAFDRIVIAVLASAVGYFAFDKFVLDADRVAATARPASLAVLPFIDLSPNKDNEYFADGMSEELLNLLAKVPQLRVASRTSSFSFKGKGARIADIGRELNVTHVLEGSVRRSGQRLRITAQLISVDDGFHVWSENFDRNDGDVFTIQDEIARQIVAALRVRMLGDVPRVEQTDPRAHALYLRGQYLERQRTAEGMAQAVELLKQALAIDPAYASAWVALSVTYSNQAASGVVPWDDGQTLAREAALKALAIDPQNALGYDRLAWIARVYDANLAVAADYCSRALALDPANDAIIGHAAVLTQSLGRLEQAIGLHEYAVSRAPADATAHFNLGLAYYFADRLDDAERAIRKVLTLSPGYLGAKYRLGTILLLKGEPEAAGRAFAEEDDEAFRVKGRALVASALRREVEAQAALTELTARWGEQWPSEIAHVHAYRGDVDAAFQWLEKDYEVSGPAGWGEWRLMRLLDNLRGDPRWQPFLEKVNASDRQLAAINFEVRLPEST